MRLVDCNGKEIPNFIPYGIPKEVTALDLSRNLIPSLRKNSFAQLHTLKYLNLDENNLEQVPADVLRGLDSLKILKLNGNYITKIETEAFIDMEKIKDIQV